MRYCSMAVAAIMAYVCAALIGCPTAPGDGRSCNALGAEFQVIGRTLDARRDTDATDGDEPDLQLEAQTILRRLNAYLKKEGGDFPVRAAMRLPVRSRGATRTSREQIVLGGRPSGVEFRFCAETQELREFVHYRARDKGSGKDAPLFDSPTQPQWSKERAARVARGTVIALLGRFPDNFALDYVEYTHPFMEAPQYYVGSWHVTFMRTDDAGSPFDNEGIVVLLLEQYGPRGVGIPDPSEYETPETEPMPRPDAIAKSLPFAQHVAQSNLARKWYGEVTLTGNTSATLLIVEPNRLLEAEHVTDIGPAERRSRRLAWQVSHEIALTARRADGQVEPRRNLLIWIDAVTGECLGGDLH